MTTDPLSILACVPRDLPVRGSFDAAPAPVAPHLSAAFSQARERWLQKISSNPKGFNGHRAVLTGFHLDDAGLTLHTAYRTYADGRALCDALAAARKDGWELPASSLRQPAPELSWGFSLLTAVLLPGDLLLCNQRSDSLMVNPGAWVPFFTEIIEPSDISGESMQPLLERLVREELPALCGLGTHRAIGLGVRKASYTWQLFSVLDLRDAGAAVSAALAELAPDSETKAWGVLALNDLTGSAPASAELVLPKSFATPQGLDPAELLPIRVLFASVPRNPL